MTNLIDRANDYAEKEREAIVSSRHSAELEVGKPGDCELCGEWFGRLVNGACVPCRNKFEKRHA